METQILGNVKRINLPDMVTWVDIREQNGEDDDIISNPVKSRDLTNFSEFISKIVVNTNYTPSGKLTEEVVNTMPTNLRYAILMASRIHSLGNDMEFVFDWGDGDKFQYSQDLSELMFEDYFIVPTEDEMNKKPFAIPYYPCGNVQSFPLTLTSGKQVRYHLLDGKGEALMIQTINKTKNLELKARGLELLVGDKWEKVETFALFSVRDMLEIRKSVSENDPVYLGFIELENPRTQEKINYSIMGTPSFFYLNGL